MTALGYHLAHLPLSPRLGKILVVASLLGCLDPCLTVCAALSGAPPFLRPLNATAAQRSEAFKERFRDTGSDLLAIIQASVRA